MTLRVLMTDEELERRIAHTFTIFENTKDLQVKRLRFDEYARLVARRSPRQVACMERLLNLRAS